ncbi:MAG: diheme cytochrome c [Gammaproteobacteria bacterium]|nr:diheme cytochrome c [Gammaproteobacteria bacterium]
MKISKRSGFRAFLAAGLCWAGMAMADEHFSTATDPTWKAECGSCHVAYPPQLLPANSWRALMSGLDKHFGSDASLDSRTAAKIAVFLEKNAGRDRSSSRTPVLRITETRWFMREHDEVPDRVWKNPQVKSAANCAACHVDGDKGDFGEHNIRIPK